MVGAGGGDGRGDVAFACVASRLGCHCRGPSRGGLGIGFLGDQLTSCFCFGLRRTSVCAALGESGPGSALLRCWRKGG
eukprot:9906683-Alexandrium_andersonii.AAC.1